MSITAQFYLLLSFVMAEMVGVVIYAIVSSEWFARKFSDKIENATVHVWNGKGYDPVKGQLIDTTLYETYRYKIHGEFHTVDLNGDYPVVYEKRKRVIYATIGRVWADTIPGHDPIRYSESENATKMCKESVREAFKALKKNGLQLSAAMILIICLVLAAIGGGAWYYTSHNKKAVVTNQPKVTTTVIK